MGTLLHPIRKTLKNKLLPEIQCTPDKYDFEGPVMNDQDWKYKLFKHEELQFLHDLSQCNLKDLTSPFSKTSDPFHFKLKNREESIKQILFVGERHYQAFPLERKSKYQFSFLFAKGGSGSGKTCILTEIPNILRNGGLDNIFKNVNMIYLSFANGFPLTDRDKNSVSMIVSRIVYAAFENPSTELVQNTPPSENDLFFYEVMRIISKNLHEKYGETVIPLVLATRFSPYLHTCIQHKLGWYMRFI
ncbi:hypothetical protein FDP41_000033 [Naegleria fowleri]|uniref:Uncharacterized protein n=1 Tax=Naegleria fowleri TaxID=5763 RepID=A0A6A5CEH9_NAEFO|nr:uncharacterized protein FDP41_000033 [Naegleria fowleri]KAF0984994.1 hypothetical protein FDP41_000033 [Naegleria fowleri]